MDERLLQQLKAAQERYLSGEELAHQLGVTRAAVWKQIEVLRSYGYEIEAQPHLGYKLRGVPDRLLDVEIRAGLRTQRFGRLVQCYDEVDTTMDIAHRLAKSGSPEGAVVFAESQRHGRGRLGRSWVSAPGQGIYGSLILRPTLSLRVLPTLTLTMAIGIAQAVERAVELPVQIKWPNDLMFRERKLGGILTELQAEQDRLEYVIVGFGLNVHGTPEQLPPEAISLQQVLGRTIQRAPLIRDILEALERCYDQLQQEGFGALQAEWRQRSMLLGSRVKVLVQTREVEGLVIDIDAEGALVLRHDTGVQERFTAGDVTKLC